MDISPQAEAPPLELRNVTKFYGDFKAVDDVSFTLPAGSICGFLGPNGAGKTTTIRMILEIIQPTSGVITVLGRPSALEVRQRIGYLPEEKGLYKKMRAWSVIAYFASLKGLTRKAARQRAFELLERYGLKDFADKPTEALSKGMGQKVQMLASIAHDPGIHHPRRTIFRTGSCQPTSHGRNHPGHGRAQAHHPLFHPRHATR
jgi:ABC-2 type transport system ATP-binding protein